METEDIIELGSSDEEPGPPPPKKMNVKNAMVHIPSNLRGVTIKPVKANVTQLPKLGKNITITKTTGSSASLPAVKPDKVMHRPVAAKNKPTVKEPGPTPQIKGKVFNPLSQKGIVHSVGNSTITRLKNPIQIKTALSQHTKPQPLQRLPPSITIKKTGSAVKPMPNIAVIPKRLPKQLTSISRKRKLEVVPTVELDDEETSTASASAQWYVRPEEQSEITANITPPTQSEPASAQEDANNKEPDAPKYIEITIEDSPIKPAKTKRTRELSTEKVITIDDSPNKGSVISDDVADDSDNESNTTKKIPHSKKKLNYPKDLPTIEEIHTVEIEIEPMEPMDPLQDDAPNTEVNKESKVISLTPEIMEVEEASVEIAQNKQGSVSVVQLKPAQLKQNPKVAPKKDVGMKSEFHPIYQSFISLCIQLENSNDMEKIIEKKIKPYYRQVPKEYRESEEFLDMVSSKITAMESAPEKMYLYIKDIVDELNHQRKYMKQVPGKGLQTKDQESFLYGKENELDPNKQRQIRKLEKTLKKLNRAIQKLEAQEVDFDDEEDSVYLLTEKYKERMVRVHAKFCQLTNTKLPSQPRLVIDPRPGLSAAPAKRLEAWINKKNSLTFPDFHDVLRCVREANENEKLGWNEAFIMEEARDLFVRCGRKLQRRRQENEWRLATSRITPTLDPAEQSDELRKQLEANRRLASTKETEVFDKFCDRQSQLKLEAEEIDDKDAEESPVESEEEDNDEDSSLESKQKRKERLRRLLQEQSKKNIPNKVPQTENDTIKSDKCDAELVDNATKNKSETVNEEDTIQSLSDDSYEIGSDMDELHLLQKLHSDSEIRTVSSSSDSETPIAISDTLDSSSEDEKQTKQQETDVISIENSSYSDDSESEKNKNPKKSENSTVMARTEIIEDREKEEPSTSTVEKTLTPTEHTLITSSEDDSNLDDNTNSGKSDHSSKVSSLKDRQASPDTDFELGILSESTELCVNINEVAKPSDTEDEQSTNSDIIDNPSSISSGQYEELLKEHNSDPLLKRPDLIPRDPSDELFDSIVIKHYNDPLIKKTLKGSDSSNGDDTENSNSDSLSTIAPVTTEEAKKDLIETSVDTEELFNSNSPSLQIVDKLVEKLKQSSDCGSQSSDDLMMKVDQELCLRTDAMSPVTFELQKAVNLARQTRAWPRFKDECSSMSSVEDNNTGDDSPSMPTKSNESVKDDFDEIEIARSELIPLSEAKDTDTCRSESTPCEQMDVTQSETTVITEVKDTSASCSTSIKDLSEEMDVDSIVLNSAEEPKRNDVSSPEGSKELSAEKNNAPSEAPFHEGTKHIGGISSECINYASVEFKATEIEKKEQERPQEETTSIEANLGSSSFGATNEISGAMDISEVNTAFTELNDDSNFNNEHLKEVDAEELINDIVSLGNTQDTDQTFKENWHIDVNESKLLNTNEIPQENSDETEESIISILNPNNGLEDRNGDEPGLISNGNLNINMDISDLLDSDTNMSQKIVSDKELDDLNELQSAEKADCNEDAVPRTISNMCLQSTDDNN